MEARGNWLADEIAKEAALEPKIIKMYNLIPRVPASKAIPCFSEKEKEELRKLEVAETGEGKWTLPDRREMLNKQLMREIMSILHQGSHWVTQAICDLALSKYRCMRIMQNTVAKQICERCVTCKKVNKKILKKQPQGGREPTPRPFQCVQVDFTKLPPVGRLKYILVFVDHLTEWVEAYPMATSAATGVARIILGQIIPRYGITKNIDSDQKVILLPRYSKE